MADLFDPPGTASAIDRLRSPAALAAVAALSRGVPYVSLVETRRTPDRDVLVLDVEPEVPQAPVHDVRPVERIAVLFWPGPAGPPPAPPSVRALRRDFPDVPHLNLTDDGEPQSLCLYEAPYSERRLTWTAEAFLRRIQEWLSLTARGELHQDDQILEPVFFGGLDRVVLPSATFEPTGDLPERLVLTRAGAVGPIRTYVAAPAAEHAALAGADLPTIVALSVTTTPSTRPHMRRAPASLAALDRALPTADGDFTSAVRAKLLAWAGEGDAALDSVPLFVVRQPLRRRADGPVETVDVWAFLATEPLRAVGQKLDAWSVAPGSGDVGVLIGADPDKDGHDVSLLVLDPVSTLTPAAAAVLNGRDALDGPTGVAVGAGALGSNLLDALVRGGFGSWAVVDKDLFLPHNAARHVLRADQAGRPKALALADTLNATLDGTPVSGFVADVLGDLPEDLGRAVREADVILDASASLPVARQLALDVESSARRVSVFLNPTGADLVVLAEDGDRRHRLDHLEAAYLRALITDPRLEGHFAPAAAGVRYAHGCHDISGRIPHESVALLGATAAGAVRAALTQPHPLASVWRRFADGSVARVPVRIGDVAEGDVGDWTVTVSCDLLREIGRQRTQRLPRETGGVLLGTTDLVRRRITVLAHIASPPDSEEWPTAYIRGVEGLSDAVVDTAGATGGQVTYVGEWHSHPAGAALRPSGDDARQFAWLADHMAQDGLPALMLIAGDAGRSATYVGNLETSPLNAVAQDLAPRP